MSTRTKIFSWSPFLSTGKLITGGLCLVTVDVFVTTAAWLKGSPGGTAGCGQAATSSQRSCQNMWLPVVAMGAAGTTGPPAAETVLLQKRRMLFASATVPEDTRPGGAPDSTTPRRVLLTPSWSDLPPACNTIPRRPGTTLPLIVQEVSKLTADPE